MTETLPRQSPPEGRPLLPEIPGPLETLALAWRRLRRMSTALVLLFAMAAASVVATFVPQEPVVPSTVAQWRAGSAGPGAGWASAFDALDLFDVFGSWWFVTLTVLLFVSLSGCLLPRYRAFWRVARRPPAVGRNLDRLTQRRVWSTALPPGEILAAADRVLRRRRFRHRLIGDRQLAAERGHWREGGSLVFHTAFYLLLVGIVVGHTFGFTGQINLVEGSAFADTRIAYDAVRPGRAWSLDDHRGFVVRLDDFAVSYFENLTPRDFVSTVTVLEDGVAIRSGQIRVNHPLLHNGMKLYQARFGMAPRVVVRAGDRLLFDERVMLADAGGNVWTGAAKVAVSDEDRQLALDLVFLPDAALREGMPVSPTPEPRNPRLVASLYFGELGLERAVPAAQFKRDAGPAGPPAILAPGETASLVEGNLTVAFPELSYWSGFQVTHAPGRWILLVAAGFILVGLLPSLYSYRRRVWVEAAAGGRGTEVLVAGAALQRQPAFTEEFAAVTAALRAELEALEAKGLPHDGR